MDAHFFFRGGGVGGKEEGMYVFCFGMTTIYLIQSSPHAERVMCLSSCSDFHDFRVQYKGNGSNTRTLIAVKIILITCYILSR